MSVPAREASANGPSDRAEGTPDIVRMAVELRAGLLCEIRMLDEFLRIGQLLLRHSRSAALPAPAVPVGDAGRAGLAPHRRWQLRRPVGRRSVQGEARPRLSESSAAEAQTDILDQFCDTFLFDVPPKGRGGR